MTRPPRTARGPDGRAECYHFLPSFRTHAPLRMPHRYQLFGLTFHSVLECPELLPARTDAPVDIGIGLARLAPELEQATFSGERIQSAPGVYQFQVGGVARYRVERGRRVLIDPAPGADAGDIRLWLLGTALGALLHQRGLLPLHASALAMDGVAHAFCGDTGAGKSTLAAALRRRGFPVLTDDVGLVAPTADSVLFHPGFPRIKLWRDALEHLGLDHRPLIRDHTSAEKYHLRLEEDFSPEPLTLRHVYVLERTDTGPVSIEPVRGIEAIRLVQSHIYRPVLAQRLGQGAAHLRLCGRIANGARLFRFRRPWGLGRLDAVLDCFLEHLHEGAH